MPKYGDIIKQAKSVKPDNQTDGLPDNQITRQPDNQKSKQQESLQSGQLANQITINPEGQQTRQPDEPMKNLCVKVPESWRRHWAAQAKLTGRTMTDVIVEALKQEFGLPENQ
ncbi:MAG: hypothetical protein D6698_15485 [Gammaproteobacteria bacterium]|nr:MAG: hypothetical protein D6698_15485 [Gammaproteobacteria bacterium]